MKRTAWLVGIVVVIAVGAFAWQRHRAAAPETPATRVAPTTPTVHVLPPAPDSQTAAHEQQETADANKIASDLQLVDHDRAALLAALVDLQQGRRALFADLAATPV